MYGTCYVHCRHSLSLLPLPSATLVLESWQIITSNDIDSSFQMAIINLKVHLIPLPWFNLKGIHWKRSLSINEAQRWKKKKKIKKWIILAFHVDIFFDLKKSLFFCFYGFEFIIFFFNSHFMDILNEIFSLWIKKCFINSILHRFYSKMCSLALRLFVHLWYFGLFVAHKFFLMLLLLLSIYSIQLRASEKVDFTVMIIKRIEKLR